MVDKPPERKKKHSGFSSFSDRLIGGVLSYFFFLCVSTPLFDYKKGGKLFMQFQISRAFGLSA